MIPVEEAQRIILDNLNPLPVEKVPLREALGRAMRQDVTADMDLPPFSRARMDGYALRAEDAATAPATLRVVGAVPAGSQFHRMLSPGEAVRIMTGAPIPAGADAVQKVEVTETDGQTVVIKESVTPGQFITPRGCEAAQGEVLVHAGIRITPAEVAALATVGYSEVAVTRAPLVNVLSTGSELVEVHQTPSAAQIRNSNSYAIMGYAGQLGASVNYRGIVPDDEEVTFRKVTDALEDADAVVLSGGVSMGDYDLVKLAVRRIGARIYFDKVCIHPGKPTVFAKLGEKAIFALPGNPVSVAVTFLTFAFPGLNALLGLREKFLPKVMATLAKDAKHAPDRRSYLPGELSISNGAATVTPLRWGGSSDLVAFMRANALIMVPEGVPVMEKGQLCQTLLIPGMNPQAGEVG
jgi:molybdenum cofactor synthesis domain-containing protein